MDGDEIEEMHVPERLSYYNTGDKMFTEMINSPKCAICIYSSKESQIKSVG